MARLKDKFTVNQLKDIDERLNEIHYSVTHYKTTEIKNEYELQLLHVIDYLVRVPGMLGDVIEQDIKGHIETSDPHSYTDSKLRAAQNALKAYLKMRNINLEEEIY